MDNTLTVILTAGIISTCFLVDKNRIDAKHTEQLQLKNDTINTITVELNNHKKLLHDIVAMADVECMAEVQLIRKHFNRNILIHK